MVSAMFGDSLTKIAARFTTELSIIDSRTSTGAQHRFKTPFDNCAFAGQRTVLQHIPPKSGQIADHLVRIRFVQILLQKSPSRCCGIGI